MTQRLPPAMPSSCVDGDLGFRGVRTGPTPSLEAMVATWNA
jgi:hypothetical protein